MLAGDEDSLQQTMLEQEVIHMCDGHAGGNVVPV